MNDLEVSAAVDRIKTLILEGYQCQATDRGKYRNTVAEQYEIQDILAEEFGHRHGWRLSKSRFSLAALKDRKTHSWKRWPDFDEDLPHYLFDHAVFYRTPDQRAVAVAAHLYNVDQKLSAMEEWSQEHGLSAEVVKDFPSWWNPGGTTLVLYTRKVSAQ